MKSSTEREINKYTPAFEPISLRESTDAEKEVDQALKKYMDGHKDMQLESDAEMSRRDSVLFEVRGIFLRWVQFVATEVLHLSMEEAEEAGGEMFVSGSQRLGVRDIGADIDVVCVAPNFCTKEHFFTFLKDTFLNHPDVTEFNAVEEAFVPLISFDFRKVSIDLLFARLAENSVPADVDILDDKILSGLDDASVVSLNGPRVTNMIVKLVGERSYPNFLIVLRCIRRWAKSRGLYGNKLGYLGGVNCNILVAFLCQLYPHSGPSNLLAKFFRLYSREWKWPEPIMLNNVLPDPPDTPLSEQKEIWSKEKNPYHIMPIITPAYPAMNSLHNVSIHTFEVMQHEFRQSHEIMDKIIQDGGAGWDRLFEKSDFFLRYSHYLECHMIGIGDDGESRRWIGFCESRIRRLLQYLEKLPIKTPIQLYPNKSKTQISSCSICYFIGFDFDMDFLGRVDNKNIHIDYCVEEFQKSLLDPERGYKGKRLEGLDFYVEHLPWKKLPKEVFEDYGGKEIARKKRHELGYVLSSVKLSSNSSSKLTANVSVAADITEPTAPVELAVKAVQFAVNESLEMVDANQRQSNFQVALDSAIEADAKSVAFSVDDDGGSRKRCFADAFIKYMETSGQQRCVALKKSELPVLCAPAAPSTSHCIPSVTWLVLDTK